MRLILPSDFGRKCFAAAMLAAISAALGCQHAAAPAVPPGEPISAEPDVKVESMDTECDGLVAAIAAYGQCPNGDDDLRAWTKRAGEIAQEAFDAGKVGKPDEKSQHVIALACHRAAVSMHYAAIRCANGPRPKSER